MINLLDPEHPETVKVLTDSISKIESGTSTFWDHLNVLSLTPTLILQHYMWEPTTDDERYYVKLLNNQYSALALWMAYLVFRHQPIPPELNHPDVLKLKPHADYSKSILDIAAELFPRFPEELCASGAATKPTDVWLTAEIQRCRAKIWISGLLRGKPTISLSKDDTYETFEYLFQFLGGESQRRKSMSIKDGFYPSRFINYKQEQEERVPALDLIGRLTKKLAEQNPDFRNRSVAYRNFKNEVRKIGIRIRHDSSYVSMEFEDGRLLPFGRKAPRVARKIQRM
ncbi:hypothetical protein SPB21_19100 [Leptothoe sp. ISB3NOV94-8A]